MNKAPFDGHSCVRKLGLGPETPLVTSGGVGYAGNVISLSVAFWGMLEGRLILVKFLYMLEYCQGQNSMYCTNCAHGIRGPSTR